MSDFILEMDHVSKHFGGVRAIDDFSLKVEKGTIYGLIGPNGAGKTTIFNTITGIYEADGGTIIFDGKDTTKIKPHEAAQQGIARTFQNIRLFSNLSVLDNVVISCNINAKYNLAEALFRLQRYKKESAETLEKAKYFLDIVGLTDVSDNRAGALPYGHQRKLEIARAMATNPKLLLLDEPAAGMNADESLELVEFVKKLHEQFPITIMMIEHHMDVVTNLCEKCTVLNFGKTLAAGDVAEVKKNPEVIAAYLGGDE